MSEKRWSKRRMKINKSDKDCDKDNDENNDNDKKKNIWIILQMIINHKQMFVNR